MRDLVVAFLTVLAEDYPYLLLGCALIGFMWAIRSVVHKLRLLTQHVTKEVGELRVEIHEWAGDLRALGKAFKLRPKDSELT